MKKVYPILILIVVVIAVVLITDTKTRTPTETVQIGFVGPLTGDVANLGILARSAAEIAVEEINKNGGVNGKPIFLIAEDGKCAPKEATTAGKKLIEIDNVSAIIGGLCSGETLAIAPLAEQNRVIAISYASSNPTITNAGDYVFRVFPSDSFQGDVAANYAFEKLGKKVAIVYTNNDYAKGIQEVFQDTFKSLGGEVLLAEAVEQGSSDARSIVTKIKQANPEVIYAPTMTAEAIVLLKQLKEQNVNANILGADFWDEQTIWDSVGMIGNRTLFTNTSTLDPSSDFMTKLKAKAGPGATISTGTLQAYDAVRILAKAIEQAGTDPEKLKNELYKTTLSGISNPNIAFDQNGDLKEASYVVKKVVNGKPEVLEKL